MATLANISYYWRILLFTLVIICFCTKYCFNKYTDLTIVTSGQHRKKNMPTRSFVASSDNFSFDDVTIITAYTNIGSFHKGSVQKTYTTSLYYRWMKVFRHIQNPVVAFFDNAKDAKYFTNLMGVHRRPCQHQNVSLCNTLPMNDRMPCEKVKTSEANGKLIDANKPCFRNISKSTSTDCEVNVFNRSTTWAFKLLPRIKEVLGRPGYPKHMPTTVVPEYQSIQHMKYELVKEVAQRNPFGTKYFAWTDIGLFRHLLSDANRPIKPFKIYLPPGFNHSRIGYNEVTPMRNVTNKDIFYRNLYWVCGCFFIGERMTILRWADEYMEYAEKFLKQGLANTDQRVIYAMQRNEQAAIHIQPYKPRYKYNRWFDLAYLCKDEGAKRL